MGLCRFGRILMFHLPSGYCKTITLLPSFFVTQKGHILAFLWFWGSFNSGIVQQIQEQLHKGNLIRILYLVILYKFAWEESGVNLDS